ncbi:MAG: zinc ribbon domain-containing protein [Anaerolineae bacterium]|nr:zinc ribbon domain-containing protein [Anaerolineae bacterium]MCO5189185.1 zinc ribbon domain-containing protein [Anaerolineae bacterium]MCO5195811.1 zinc ribbon domain-containing protein [Anaerolineae bacterium]MCO5196327.1 zinc ribbon domain-containing protein [Anaerolineae bacterium]MCO5204379.1 zinc ribbon domain-containing protein [Anaerolineae bacterium]
MPMYSFVCKACGQPFDKRLRMSQSDVTQECPACGSGETRKRITSAFAVGGTVTERIPQRPASSPFT